MLSKFFIDRPIGATVLSAVIVIVGLVALLRLPIAQYPEVVPPTVSVTTSYPGASAKVVAETVATPIEQEVNGVENMLYMSSRSTNDGNLTLDVTFALGTNLDMAQVLVQNRVKIAEPKLPETVRRQGVTTKKKSPNILLVVNLISPDGRYDQLYLSNYATIKIKDKLARIKGVGDVDYLGARDYSMRIWLDPDKLATRGMLPADFTKALQEQNVQVAAGRIGQAPAPAGQNFQYTVNTLGRLMTEEQFADIVVKTGTQGEIVRVRDVVRDPEYRVVLDPAKLTERGLTPDAVLKAILAKTYLLIKRQDQVLHLRGTSPASSKLGLENVVVREGKPGVPLKDVIKSIEEDKGVQLGAKNYDVTSFLDGQPCVSLATFQLPGANAVDTAHEIKDTMKRLSKDFPPGVAYEIDYDTTVFIEESVESVYHTLLEAFVLVFIVVLIFLQDWRATILPMIEVPVSLIGTLAVMGLLGFSLNNLSLFGLVLAIGIVVDDAIVVIENVERWIAKGLPPREATIKAMEETTGPILAIAVVLCAVFIPSVFMAGITGQFFRQFALTIAASTLISALNALTMTPARCVLMMRPHSEGHEHREPLPRWGIAGIFGLAAVWLLGNTALHLAGIKLGEGESDSLHLWGIRAGLFFAGAILGWLVANPVNFGLAKFFAGFNRAFDGLTSAYGATVRTILRFAVVALVIYGGLIGLTWFGFTTIPTGFIPDQDKGYVVVSAQLPDGASLQRTEEVSAQLVDILRQDKAVANVLSIPGYSILTNGTNQTNVAGIFAILKPFEERKENPRMSADAAIGRLRGKFADVLNAQVVVFGAPPVDGLGNTGGFKMQVQDKSGGDLESLQTAAEDVVRAGNANPRLVGLFTSFRAGEPQLYLEVDRSKVKNQNVNLSDVFNTLQIYLGSEYVNDLTLFNRNWQVNVQADARHRARVDDIGNLKVRNAAGEMVLLRTLITIKEVTGPSMVSHYNLYPSAAVDGNPAPGTSSGEAIALMEQLARKVLPRGTMGYAWTELTYQQVEAEKDLLSKLAFPLAVAFVFLALAFQYESWSLPLAVILIVPMCLLAAIAGVWIAQLDNNIFTQIGLLVLVALAAKNAILIVEFAKARQEEGLDRFEAAAEAARLRLRPILMTSFAFILGVVPLVLAKGAGAEMRYTLGVAVFSGMLGVTFFGVFFTPVFYVVISRFRKKGAETSPALKQAVLEEDGKLLSTQKAQKEL